MRAMPPALMLLALAACAESVPASADPVEVEAAVQQANEAAAEVKRDGAGRAAPEGI